MNNCPKCSEPLMATDTTMYCPLCDYERPLDESNEADVEAREAASEKFWLGRNGF